jgi:hypothetical protein
MRPIIEMILKKHLADYCRHEFELTANGNIILNRKHDIGKVIDSLTIPSRTPVKPQKDPDLVRFELPLSSKVDLNLKYFYVDKWREQKIQDYIEAEFNLRTKLFFEKGYQLGYTQKEIIEAFLSFYNIKHNSISYDAVKQNDFRRRRKTRQIIANEILVSVNQ